MTGETAPETAQQAAYRFATPMLEKGFEANCPACLHRRTRQRYALQDPSQAPATGEKWIRPMHAKGSGWELREPQFPNGKPLYRLHELAQNAGRTVLVCRGRELR